MRKQGLLRACKWRWLAAGLVALLMSTGVTSARAGNVADDAKQAAKARFTAGQMHYNLNEFPEALREFKEAYRLYSDPVFLFNLGQCERQLGHAEEAIRFYRSYLREQPKAPNRAEVQRRIEEMELLLKTKQAETDKAMAPTGTVETVGPPSSEVPAPLPTAVTATEAAPVAAPSSPEPPPATTAQASPSPSRVDLTTTPSPPAEPVPVYKRWWVWAAAAVVVGAGVGIYAAMANKDPGAPDSGLGSKKVF